MDTQSGGAEHKPRKERELHETNPYRKAFFGSPVATENQEHSRLPKILALPIFASDAISSVAYATQEILLALSVAGVAALSYTQHISVAIALLLIIVALSYLQTIFAYSNGGGSYVVAKENIGVSMGLIAAGALLIDYILTVATSIAAGVQNLIPMIPAFKGHEVALCVGFVLLLLLANLRGLREAGAVFAIPTYSFVAGCLALIGFGIFGPMFGWHLNPATATPLGTAKAVGMGLLLNAFARGCSAMTGTEAISNGIPAFQKPAAKNAAITLILMAAILGTLFTGISFLAIRVHVVYVEGSAAVIDQLNAIVFGKGTAAYYFLQVATVAILVLAANTSFAGFPGLSSILARDGFLPRQLCNIGDKLNYTNGTILLAVFSISLLVAFGGNTDKLVPLYAIGVFIAFSLSQAGMVIHWMRERGKGWQVKATINSIGALATFVVLCTIAYEKIVIDIVYNRGREFGWIVLVLVGVLYVVFRIIEKHYKEMAAALSMDGYSSFEGPVPTTALIIVPRVHRGVMEAVEYGRTLTGDVRGVHIDIDGNGSPNVLNDWEKWVPDIPLIVLPSPFRSVIGPLMAYLDAVERERPNAKLTVIVPEAVTGKWWHKLLHANYAAWIKFYLLHRHNVIVTNVRYYAGTKSGADSPQAELKVTR